MSRAKKIDSSVPDGFIPDYGTMEVSEWAEANGFPTTKIGDFAWNIRCPWRTSHLSETTPPAILSQGQGGIPDFQCSDAACEPNNGGNAILELWKANVGEFCKSFTPMSPGEDAVVPHDPKWKGKDGKVRSPYGHFINALGFDEKNNYWYQTGPYGHVVSISLGSHNKTCLNGLVANTKFWFAFAGNSKTGKVDWDAAATQLTAECHAKGHFRPENVRGIGLWWDDGRIVANLGNRLLVDGKETKLFDIKGDYFYDSNHKALPLLAALSDEALRGILPLVQRLPFKDESGAIIMTGMAIIGLMPTLLKWRPQVWIYGAQGSGKSQLMRHTVGAIWGGVFGSQYQLEGVTTEPAVRQIVQNSAVSITLDDQEVEEDDRTGMSRILSLIRLARSSATDSDASTAKGSGSGGRASLFNVRSCFVFNSIACPIEKGQDRERFFAIAVRPQEPGKPDLTWPALEADLIAAFDKKFSLQLFSWVAANARKITRVVSSFTMALLAAGEEYGLKRRYCDQWGTALGAAWCTQNPDRDDIYAEEAVEFFASVYKRVEYEQHVVAEGGVGSERAVRHLLDYIPKERGGHTSIAEMVDEVMARGGTIDGRIGRHDQGYAESADMHLRRYGMRVEGVCVWIALGHSQLRRIFNEAGIMNYPSALISYPGAKRVDKPTKFQSMSNGYVSVPIKALFETDEEMPVRESRTPTAAEMLRGVPQSDEEFDNGWGGPPR